MDLKVWVHAMIVMFTFDPDTSIFHFVGTVAEKNVSEKEVLVSCLRCIASI